MKKYIYRILLVSVLTFAIESLIGQNLELIKKPSSELINSCTEIIGSTSYSRLATDWYVFSNKNNNKLYSDANAVIGSDIGFLEPFNVLAETPDKVKVKKLGGAELGWMNKKDLILLDHCERKANMVSKKAMIINILEPGHHHDTVEQYRFFYDPELRQRNIKEKRNVYEILYVYQETDNALLLGEREDCSSIVTKYLPESIIGWIDKDAVTAWDSRGCLLPNYTSDAKSERITRRTSPAILDTSAMYKDSCSLAKGYNEYLLTYPDLQQFAEVNEYEKNPIVWNEEIKNRWPPSKFRLPYLDKHHKDEDIMKVGVLGDIKAEDGALIQDLIDRLREMERMSSSQRSLNLVFVIDGTASMRNYFPAVANAISQSHASISADPDFSDPDNPNRVTVKCGAVVYRDVPEGAYLAETCPLQDFNTTRNWISSNFQDIKNRYDKDIPEAVFFGLFNALEDVLVGHESENNLIILIGDAGDSQQDNDAFTEMQDLIDGLYRNNCHFIAYQTHWRSQNENPENISYTEFCDQMQEICEMSARKLQVKVQNIGVLEQLQNTVSLINVQSTNDYDLFALDVPFIANKVYCNKGNQMDANKLKDFIVESIRASSKNVSLVNKIIHDILYSGKSWEEILADYNLSVDDYASLAPLATTLGYIVGELKRIYPNENVTTPGGKLDQLLMGKLQLYFEGFAPLKIEGSRNNLWSFEILTIASTKKNLERDFMRVISAFRTQGDEVAKRQAIYDAFVTLAQTYAGDEKNYDNVTIGILFAKIIDCPGLKFSNRYRDCLSIKIRQTRIEQECSNDCLDDFYNEIFKSYNRIKSLSYQEYVTTAFKTFSAYYIPVELMPFVN
jgi:hypothetical protein